MLLLVLTCLTMVIKVLQSDQVKITWEMLTNHVVTLYGTNIGTELATNVKFSIPKPMYSANNILVQQHEKAEIQCKEMAQLLKDALDIKVARIKPRIKLAETKNADPNSNPYLLAEKVNKVKVLQKEIDNDEPLQLKVEAKKEYDADLKI